MNNFNIFTNNIVCSKIVLILFKKLAQNRIIFTYLRVVSKPSPGKYQRLNFPQVGDSGFYGGVGRKHYDSSIKDLILK